MAETAVPIKIAEKVNSIKLNKIVSDRMSIWKECKLQEIAEIQTGPFGSQLHRSDYKAIGTPIITVEHLGDNRVIHFNLPLVGDLDKKRLQKYTLKKGDIVFSRVGSVDRSAFVHESEDGWMFSGRLLRVRANEQLVDPRFLSFYFSQESFRDTIRMIAVGATMPSINTGILSNINVHIPDLPQQRAIAAVLSSLDDKIDLLHRQNKTLEGMAEALWRKMFIEEADPNWKTGKLGDLVELCYGKALKGDLRRPGKFPVIGSSGIVGYHNDFLAKGPGIVIGRKGTLGVVNYIEDDFFPIDTTYFIKSKINSEKLYFEYFLLKEFSFEEMNSDSAVPGLNREIAESMELAVPARESIYEFNSWCSSLFTKKIENEAQIRTLTHQRDALLPKLMSGGVRVKL